MRYNEVMGQIDMYPTILSLLQVNNYAWKGMGQTIFDSRKAPLAISPNGEVVGNTKGVSAQEISRLKRAWHISDLMLRFNKMPSKKKSDGIKAKKEKYKSIKISITLPKYLRK